MTNNLSKIIPRWEWRTFAPSLSSLQPKLPPPTDEPRSSTEIYLVRQTGSQNVKIRDNQIDIKQLRAVDKNGFELWEPVFKARFPLSAVDVDHVFEEWGAEQTSARRDNVALDQFLTEVVASIRGVRIVHVEKSRRGFEFGGCLAELAEVSIEGKRLESFSIESEDTRKMAVTLEALGLSGSKNISYPTCLSRRLEVV